MKRDQSVEYHIGMDDTDSASGGCTTYTGTILFQTLLKHGFEFSDHPWLVRLNPNIPWKTRGNGAVSLHLRVRRSRIKELKQLSLLVLKQHCDIKEARTDPAIVFFEGKIPSTLNRFAKDALDQVISLDYARQICEQTRADACVLKGERGMIGALAAIGVDLRNEETFELIAYRTPQNYGATRRVNAESVMRMDSVFGYTTFNNVDHETKRILICPHGPDPVLFGIRGNNASLLQQAACMILVDEPIETVSIFRTNAATDAHLQKIVDIDSLTRFRAAVVNGSVETVPKTSPGGHVFFKIRDNTGSITCAAFYPTGSFRKTMFQLIPGDLVKASGGIQKAGKYGLTLNLEKMEVIQLAQDNAWSNPSCNKCGAKCESQGRNQGFRCRKCSMHYPHMSKVRIEKKRTISTGLYMPPPRANRHLTRPLSRPSSSRLFLDYEPTENN